MIKIEINGGDLNAITKELNVSESQITKASVRALNKTAVWLKGRASKEISKEAKVKQKQLRRRLDIIRASTKSLKAFVMANLRGIKAAYLGKMRQTARGVKVGAHSFDGAFIAKMPRGHKGVFKRKTKARLPIQEMYVPLEPHASKKIEELTEREVSERFMYFLSHELMHMMRSHD